MFCRKCGNEIPEDSAFCPKCGEKVTIGEFKESALSVNEQQTAYSVELGKGDDTAIIETVTAYSGQLICKGCGKPIPKGNVFCPICGTDIPSEEILVEDRPINRSKLKIILIWAGVLVAVLAVVLLTVILSERHSEFKYEFDEKNGYYVIQGTKKDMKDIEIPDTIWFKPVYAITDEAFAHSEIESVRFGKNIKEIGERAFDSCTKLKSVEFRGSYENSYIDTVSIGTGAFYNCSSLSDLTLPSVNTIIGDGAFYKCKSLKRIYLGYVSRIGQIAFSESGLTSLEVDCNVGMAAFSKCINLDNVYIYPVATLASNIFEGCTNLKEVTICTSTIPAYTFSMCSNLEKVYWTEADNDYAEIGSYSFANCSSLLEIVACGESTGSPSDITDYNSQIEIGEGAFDGCDNFKSPQSTSNSGYEQSDDRSENIIYYDAVYLADMTYNDFTSAFGLPEKGYYLGSVHYNKADVDVYGGMEGYDPYSNDQVVAVTVYGGKEITFCENLHLGEHISYYDSILDFDVYDSLETGNLQGFTWYELGLLFTDGQTGRRYNVTVRLDTDTFISYAVKVSWDGGYGM